jgi:hypothetical protein
MRIGLRIALGSVLGALAASSTGCSLIGLTVGTLCNPTRVVAVLDDGTEVRGRHATPDSSGSDSRDPAGAFSRQAPRVLVLRQDEDADGQRLAFGKVRSIEGHRGDLEVVLNDGSRLLGTRAIVKSVGDGEAPATAASDGGSAARPSMLLLATRQVEVPAERLLREGWTGREWEVPMCWEGPRVPLERVRELRPHRSLKGTWTGLAVGALVDAAIIIVIAATWEPINFSMGWD